MPPQSIGTKQSISYSRIDKNFNSEKLQVENDPINETVSEHRTFLQTVSSYPNHLVSTLRASFKSLEHCPRELYINFVLKFFESYSYFAISQILVIYLHTGKIKSN